MFLSFKEERVPRSEETGGRPGFSKFCFPFCRESHKVQGVAFPVIEGMAESLNPHITLGVYSFSRMFPDTCSGLLLLSVTTLVTGVFPLQRPQPSAETKTQTPKFDLLASNFPPLPGSTAKILGEPVLESRMSDIVKGVCKEKVPGLVSVHTREYRGAVTPFPC